jgi:small neutral amino acid transporter SnatA (MarC family)
MTPARLTALLIVAGAVVAVFGVALVSIPAAIIAGGVCLAALGIDERRRA